MGQSNKEKIKDADRQGASEKEQEKRNRFLKKLIVVLAVAIVVTFTVFYVIYYRFSYQADKLTKETARIYALAMAAKWQIISRRVTLRSMRVSPRCSLSATSRIYI